MEKHFLENYKVHDKPEAKKAAEKKEQRTGEKIFSDRSERIVAYIERLENVFLNPSKKVRERNIEILKPAIYNNTIIKDENFPESFFEYKKQEMKRHGLGEVEFSDEEKQKEIANVQEAQRKSLDAWIDHLLSEESHYPADIKYFAMQGILRTGSFDESTYQFGKRNEFTTASFRQIDHEALSMVMGALDAVQHHGDVSFYHPKLLECINRNKDFGSMYAEAMRYLDKEAGKDKALEITDGEWRVFKKGSDPQELVMAFAGKRAFQCLGNIGDASGCLKRGDIQVYFSNNRAGKPVWPRVAVAINPDGGAYEMRGTFNSNEDIDPEIAKTDIIRERLASIPNGKLFIKKDSDMRQLTRVYQACFRVDKKTGEKVYLKTELTKDDLIFLYEIDSKIKGFGYEKDPRVAELRKQRKPKEDALIVFDCTPDQIATTQNKITENTKAYIGPLFPGIFKKSIKHLYTSFPEGKIKRLETKIGGKTREEYKTELNNQKKQIGEYANQFLESKNFTISKNREDIDLVRITVLGLGFKNGATADEIYKRAEELGLELCPPEIGPALRLSYHGTEQLLIAMKQILDRDGYLRVFSLDSDGDDLWLDAFYSETTNRWNAGEEFVFRTRKEA